MEETVQQAGGAADEAIPENETTGYNDPPLTTQLDLEAFYNRKRDEQNAAEVDGADPDVTGSEDPEETDAGGPSAGKASTAEEDTEEDPGETEESGDDVLSNRTEKRIQKLIAKLDEANRRAEEAEARANQAREGEDQESNTGTGSSIYDMVSQASTPEEMRKLYDQAQAARKFALRNMHQEYVEINGEEKSHDEIVDMLEVAEEVINTTIPQRIGYLQQRETEERIAHQLYPGWDNPDSEQGKFFQTMMADPITQDIYRRLPNGKRLLGMLYKGMKAEEAELKKAQEKQPEKSAAAQTRQPAPSLPGMRSSTTTNRIPPSQKQVRERATKEQVAKGPMTRSDLEAFFANQF